MNGADLGSPRTTDFKLNKPYAELTHDVCKMTWKDALR